MDWLLSLTNELSCLHYSSVWDCSSSKNYLEIQLEKTIQFWCKPIEKTVSFWSLFAKELWYYHIFHFQLFFEVCFNPISAIVTFYVGTYFDVVRSVFSIKSLGILCFITAYATSLWNCIRTSSHNKDIITGWNAVAILGDMFILF